MKPKVYFLKWESKSRLPEFLELSGASKIIGPKDFVAVKMHFGEKGNDGFIKPEFVRPILDMIRRRGGRAFLTDTGTIYNGSRSDAVNHLKIAAEHGFSENRLHVPVIIADGLRGDDYEHVDIRGTHFGRVKIASGIRKSDVIFVLSHFKGHLLSGFGGAVKNLGMGCSSRLGKFEMHSSVSPSVEPKFCQKCGACIAKCNHGALSFVDGKINLDTALCAGCGECVIVCDWRALSISWNEDTRRVQEKLAEYATGAVKGKRAFYMNFANHITPNCDCMSEGERPLLPDLGIFASSDPVAIDKASLDMVIQTAGDVFAKAHNGIDGTIQLAHSEKMGLGKNEYELINIT